MRDFGLKITNALLPKYAPALAADPGGRQVDLTILIVALALAGLAAGFLGGLFGVGGGLLMVPALVYLFGALGAAPAARAHLAVGTSLAVVVVTSFRSLGAHRKSGAVDGQVLRDWGPWVALGGAAGAGIAGQVSGAALLGVFGFAAMVLAVQFAFGDPKWRVGAHLPRGGVRAVLGAGLGALSALMGIGGGSFGATLLTLFGRPIHQAVATASGFGAFIAIPAALGYVWIGWGMAGRAPYSLGYVNLLGFGLLAVCAMATAPMGARLAHRLDGLMLRRLFAIFLAMTALNLLYEAFRA